MIDAIAGVKTRCVGAAGEIRRHAPVGVGFPTGVFEIIIVKVDRAILLGRMRWIGLAPVERVSRHGLGWHVDQPTVVPSDEVAHVVIGHRIAQIPKRRRVGRLVPRRRVVHLAVAQQPMVDSRRLELAVEMSRRGGGTGRVARAGDRAEQQWGVTIDRDVAGQCFDHGAGPLGAERVQWPYRAHHHALLQIEAGGDEVPRAPSEGRPRDRDRTVAEVYGDDTLLIKSKRDARPAVV